MVRRSDHASKPATIDFIVWGKPKSQGSRRKKRWQARVERGVPAQTELLPGPHRLRIDYFYDGTTDLDADNIIKPIQDALKGIVYANDETVIDVCSRKINLQQLPPFGVAPATLQAALSKPRGDFVFIRIADAHPQLEFS